MSEFKVDGTFLMWIVGILLAVLNVFITYTLAGVREQMRNLAKADKELAVKIEEHREDVIKNYVTSAHFYHQMNAATLNIIDRIDRFEKTVTSLIGRRDTDRD